VSGSGDDESLKQAVQGTEERRGLFQSKEIMRHLKLNIEREVERAIEGGGTRRHAP